MNPNNPLLIYRNWYLELDLEWADVLAREIFRILCKYHLTENAFQINLKNPKKKSNHLGIEAGKFVDLVDLIDRLLLNGNE